MTKKKPTPIKFSDFFNSFTQTPERLIYLLYGTDSYFIQLGVELLLKRFVDVSTDAFNFQTFYGHETSSQEIIDSCQTLPFLSQNRIILLKYFDAFTSTEQDKFIPYFEDPCLSTHLIITAEKIDLRKKVCQELLSHGTVVQCSPLYDSQLAPWIRYIAKTMGMELSDLVMTELKNQYGNNLLKLKSELEKISLYHDDQKDIRDIEAVRVVSGMEKDHSVFDLIGNISQKDLEAAIRILKKILENGEHPLMILTMLVRQYRLIWRSKELQAKKTPSEEILKKLGVHPYFGQTLLREAKLYSKENLISAFMIFKEADTGLKENYKNPWLLLENLIFQLCQSPSPLGGQRGSTLGVPNWG